MAIVDAVLLVLALSNVKRRTVTAILWASMAVFLGACGSDAVEQAEVVSATPTPLATTPPLVVPTASPAPDSAPAVTPRVVPTPLPTATVAPTPLPTATVDPTPSPTVASSPGAAPTEGPTATVEAEVIETPTPTPTPTEEAASEPEPTSVAPTPTDVVVASGEPPLECYDPQVQIYRAFVEGVDELSFEVGRVYCTGAGTNAVSAAGSYRHSSGLIVSRNADFILDAGGTGYIPYSGSMHFCVDGQPASAPFRADTVPALLVVIDNEARRHLAEGATSPASFTGSGTQC